MIIFDTETTGLIQPELTPLHQQPEIIEVGLMRTDDKGVELERFTCLVRPKGQLTEKITEITGITDADLHYADPFSAVLPKMQAFCKGETVLIGHNLDYDRKMLLIELRRLDALARFPWPYDHRCTMQLMAPRMPGGKWPKQFELYQYLFQRPIPPGSHRAMNDVENLAEIVREMIAKRYM